MKLCGLGILLSALIALLAGCGSSEGSRKEADSSADVRERKVPLSQVERQFNPADYDDELETVVQQHEIEQQRAASEASKDSLIIESEPTQGYRIQIFATSNIDEANAMRLTTVQRVTEDSVYIVYDPPVYKVRVGDFRTRAEASQKLGTLSTIGFADAWVVSDRILLRRMVRVPSVPSPRRD
jgi:septal ring-binding cell division protein DamX